MSQISCPECAAENAMTDDVEMNEIIVCQDCGIDLEIVSLNPPTVDLAPMEEEDWGE